jgi:C1A family cysteine protease
MSFEEYEVQFNKHYAEHERETRRAIFEANMRDAAAKNAKRKHPHAATFGATQMADLTAEEFHERFLMQRTGRLEAHFDENKAKLQKANAQAHAWMKKRAAPLPDAFDWRTLNAVTAVKDQGQCGSCWSFATIENVESVAIIAGKATNISINLAPQQLVDCCDLSAGCAGGFPEGGYTCIEWEKGIETTAQYPYTGQDGTCQLQGGAATTGSLQITGWQWASGLFDEHAMQAALVASAPLAVCVDASQWQTYTGGVFTGDQDPSPFALDHCVQLVGYNATAPIPYWAVRNSWNVGFGINGYINLEMWKQTCGIGYAASTATM